MRTTQKTLDALLLQLAIRCGVDIGHYAKNANGKYEAQLGNLAFDRNIGGVQVQQISNVHGGVSTPFGDRRHTKGQMEQLLRFALDSIRFYEDNPQANH